MADQKDSFLLDLKDDVFPFVLALTMILTFFIIVYWFVRPADTDNVDKVITAFVAWIGAIIGFYFGNKPVKDLRKQVQSVSNEAGKNQVNYNNEHKNFVKTVSALSELNHNVELYTNEKAPQVKAMAAMEADPALGKLIRALEDSKDKLKYFEQELHK